MARKADTNPIAAIEAEIDNLATRRTSLEDRRTKAADQFEAARTARKTALANDPAADLAPWTIAVRDAEDEIEVLDGTLHDLAEQMDDARRRLTKARDQDERAAAVAELNGMAVALDDAAANLATALKAVGNAYRELVHHIPAQLELVKISDRTVEASALARILLAEGLASVIPDAFTNRSDGAFIYSELARGSRLGDKMPANRFSDRIEVQKVLDTATAARLLVSDRLRARVAAVEEGRTSASLSDRDLPRLVPRRVEEPTTVQITATEDFAFRFVEDGPKTVGHRAETQTLPIAVAEKIIAAGAAVRADSQEAEAIRAEEAERTRPNVTSISDASAGAKVALSPRAPGSIQYRDLGILGPAAVPVFRSVNVGRNAA